MTHQSTPNLKRTQIEKLASQILLYKELYYLGRAAISDEAYDALENELKSLDPTHPALSFVGYEIRESSAKVAHRPAMLSLAKTYQSDDLPNFAQGRSLVLSDKVDGMALSIEYDFDGRLLRASTRGNGNIGEDVTAHVMHVLSLPKHLKMPIEMHDIRIEVRGEIYFPIGEFPRFTDRFDSYRNAVPGTFGRKEVDEAVDVLNVLKFRAYDLMLFRRSDTADADNLLSATDCATFFGSTYFEKLKQMQNFGFDTGLPEATTLLLADDFVKEKLAEIVHSSFDKSRDHQIDGLVLRINDEQLFEALGTTSHHPRGSLAFKRESEVAVTEILAIETSIGRSGKVTFRAQVKPVQLSGAMISYATLHNAEFIKSAGYAPGALVKLTRSGEVIPSIIGLEKAAEKPYEFPKTCPCGYPLLATGPDLFCSQNISCAPKDQESLLYFAQTLEILGLSEKTVSKLRESGLLKTPADFFRLTLEDALSLEGFARKSAENLISSIQSKRIIPLSIFLATLGLKRGGIVKCKEVAARFGSLQQVLKVTAAELAGERGWAEKSAADFVESLRARQNWIEDLLNYVTVEDDSSQQKLSQFENHPLSGKNICITGALSQPREIYAKKLEKVGAKVASSVTSKTNFLVCNEESGSSKFVQARKLGIPILTEHQLNDLLGQISSN
ncbi:NAD-dependent DNA ligase LigA [bacterium]|nr:NAD-dependent DNA ligase LigA [bacterium]